MNNSTARTRRRVRCMPRSQGPSRCMVSAEQMSQRSHTPLHADAHTKQSVPHTYRKSVASHKATRSRWSRRPSSPPAARPYPTPRRLTAPDAMATLVKGGRVVMLGPLPPPFNVQKPCDGRGGPGRGTAWGRRQRRQPRQPGRVAGAAAGTVAWWGASAATATTPAGTAGTQSTAVVTRPLASPPTRRSGRRPPA